jgi:hypothetical protein
MNKFFIPMILVVASSACIGQSGTPSAAGQSITPGGQASAEAAVKARHDRVVAKVAKRAARRASAASS